MGIQQNTLQNREIQQNRDQNGDPTKIPIQNREIQKSTPPLKLGGDPTKSRYQNRGRPPEKFEIPKWGSKTWRETNVNCRWSILIDLLKFLFLGAFWITILMVHGSPPISFLF